MEILEQSPPIRITNESPKLTNGLPVVQTKQKELAYTKGYIKLLLGYALIGLLISQFLPLLSTLSGSGYLNSLLGILLGLIAGYYRANYSLGDLTDWQIALLKHKKVVSPFNVDQIEPDSYDVLLGSKYSKLTEGGKEESIEADEIIIEPSQCLLAHTLETFHLPKNLKGTLQGKSSWARLSLFVECAGLFDKGFKGTAVLELYNASPNPILLKRGDKIAQMSFHRTLPASLPYGHKLRSNHYQGQEGARSSWLTKRNRIII